MLCNCDSRNYIIKIWRYIRLLKQNKFLKKCNYSLFTISKLSANNLPKLKENLMLKNPIDFYSESIKYDVSKGVVFAYIGRVSKEKGVDIFCQAISRTNYIGYVFGDGPELLNLRRQYNGFNNIKFFGWVDKKQLYDYLKYMKCLVFPSIWYEGAPLTIPEIQSAGIPVICSDACSGVDYIIDGKNGFIFKSSNIDDLLDKMVIIANQSVNETNISRINIRNLALSNNSNVDQYINYLIDNLNKGEVSKNDN